MSFLELKRVRLQTLARVLSDKGNLTLMFGPDASTDLKNIRLILFEKEIEKGVPATKEECWIAQKATCAHEAGHIKFTSSGVWEKAVEFGGRQMALLLNIIEDARIERCMANAYPGTLMWFRFANDYIFINRKDWGTGPKALIGGLISYALVGRIPEPIQEQEDVMGLIDKCAPYINAGRLEKDTEGVYEYAKKVWGVIKDYIGSFTPPISLPRTLGTKEPEKALEGTLDPRREPKPIKPEESTPTDTDFEEKDTVSPEHPIKEEEIDKPETEIRESSTIGEDRSRTEKSEKHSEDSEVFEESKDSKECEKTGFDEKPEGKSDKSADHEKEAKGAGDKDSSSDSSAEEEGKTKEAGDKDSSDTRDDGYDDSHEEAGDKSSGSDPSEEIKEEPGVEHDESKPEDDPEEEPEEYPEDDPEKYPEDDLGEGSEEEFPSDEDFDDESLPEPDDESWGTDESAHDSSKDSGTLSTGIPGESGESAGESIDMGDYSELLEAAGDELSTIEETASRISKSEAVDSPEISLEEITEELSKGINEGCVFILKKNLRVDEYTRKVYEDIYSEVKGYVNKTVHEIRKILEYKTTVKERNLRKGTLDSGSLWKLHVKDPKVFCKVNEPNDIPKLAVYLLVDCSASMGTVKVSQARKAACLLYEVCQQLKIPVNVTGFSGAVTGTRDVTHYQVVDFDDKPEKKYALPHLKAISENRDGYSIRVATRELLLRNEAQKVLIVLSDGMPCMPYRSYSRAPGEKDTALAVREAEKKQVGVIGLFFGSSYELPRAQRLYNNLIFVKEVQVLPQILAKVLKKVISNL
ncbi:MAG: Cobalamin biosynthesis protein CobT VWA domain protein [Pelotomaculum sp. PtaB.Bin104]|nr:MAG: Cobalamin biosynthesis protein CobT VWA domain protein [Pelotomaculum sp. PtaB.Bin104]